MTGREYLALGIAGSVVIGLCVLAFGIPGSGDSGGFATYTPPPARDLLAQAKTETADPTDSPEPTDTPSPRPTTYAQYMREQKREFLAQVNESISGAMIAGNRFKYVGKAVDLHCTVNDIPGRA